MRCLTHTEIDKLDVDWKSWSPVVLKLPWMDLLKSYYVIWGKTNIYRDIYIGTDKRKKYINSSYVYWIDPLKKKGNVPVPM